MEGFPDVGQGEKSRVKKDNKFPHKKAHHEGEWKYGPNILKGEKAKQFQGLCFKLKGNFVKKKVPLKGSQAKGNINGKPKGVCFNCNKVEHYCPKPKLGNGGSKAIAPTANLIQGECDYLMFLKGKVYKQEVLCLLDTWASHNFITQNSVERMELQLEDFKTPIEVHFVDGVQHATSKRHVFQLGNWRGKLDLLVSILRGMECILGMEFITHNNVFIEGHNRLIRIPSKNGIIRVKTHKVPNVGGSTIHLTLGKTWEKECMGGCGML